MDKLGSFHSIPPIKFDYQFYMWGINYIMAFRMNENGFHLNRTFTHIDKLSNAILCLEAWLRHFFTLKIHSEVSSEVMLQSNKPSAQARVSARLKIRTMKWNFKIEQRSRIWRPLYTEKTVWVYYRASLFYLWNLNSSFWVFTSADAIFTYSQSWVSYSLSVSGNQFYFHISMRLTFQM